MVQQGQKNNFNIDCQGRKLLWVF